MKLKRKEVDTLWFRKGDKTVRVTLTNSPKGLIRDYVTRMREENEMQLHRHLSQKKLDLGEWNPPGFFWPFLLGGVFQAILHAVLFAGRAG
jgi:hypothetical protein